MDLFSKKKRVISEMAKTAEKRIFGRLIDDKKIIYITGKFIEQNPNSGANSSDIERLKAKFKSYIERNGLTWEAYCAAIYAKLGINPNTMTSYYTFINKWKNANEGRYKRLYDRIIRTINVHKDDIDRNYIDTFFKFNEMLKDHTYDEAYEETHLGDFIEWFKNNEEEARDRFAGNYDLIAKKLRRWLDPENYHGSVKELLDKWDEYQRIKKTRRDFTLDETSKYKLAKLVQSPGIERYIPDATKLEFLKTQALPKLFPGERLPSVEECAEFLGEGIPFEQMSPKGKIRVVLNDKFNGYRHPQIDVVATIREFLEANPGIYETGVVADSIGSVDRERVKETCRYAVGSLNRRYRVDTNKPFPFSNVQGFYDTYKPVFLLGFNQQNYEKLFEKFAEKIKTVLERG